MSSESPTRYVLAIQKSGKTIYDPIEVGSELYIPSPELEALLNNGLRGFVTTGLPLRTRSKAVKAKVCEVLGYSTPKSFKKTKPRFPSQNFDTYIQKSNNLQIWNEELSATRRYVLIREENGMLTNVRVIAGGSLAKFDTTGTLTQKYQARLVSGLAKMQRVSETDTPILQPFLTKFKTIRQFQASPINYPESGQLLPVAIIYKCLKKLVGESFPDTGRDQERNRGAALHHLVCSALGYTKYADDGQFPDIKHQLIEVKLQTSPTIDLGLAAPDSVELVDIPAIESMQIRHCDIRYAIFSAKTDGLMVTIDGLYLITGADFFSRFPRFGGKILNKKLQIPLPDSLFETKNF